MNIDELARRTTRQILELQEEYRQRVAPLQKILSGIYDHKSMPPFVVSYDAAKSWGFSPLDSPEYKDAQEQKNRMYREAVAGAQFVPIAEYGPGGIYEDRLRGVREIGRVEIGGSDEQDRNRK